MTGPALVTADDHRLAARIATEAGAALVEHRARLLGRHASAWQVMDEGDALGHHVIVEELRAARPDDAVLSEEGRAGPPRVSAPRVWVVDPLDGTSEYGEGRADWAVHVALVVGGVAEAGAVAIPSHGLTLCTDDPPVRPPRRPGPVRIVTSRVHPPYAARVLASALGAHLVPLGSAGCKTMAVALGEADIYAHAGGQYEWDSAAPTAVARASGIHVSRLDGSPLVYNRPDPWLPDVLVCRPELARPCLEALWG